MHIISASRRTDIPAFYMPWFMNRLIAGFASYPNPVSGQTVTVGLQPDDVHSIVFWSKHYAPFLPHIDELGEHGYRFVCHYTITGAPRTLEPHVPCWEHAVQIFRELADRTSPQQVLWRFDPILVTPELDAVFYRDRFQEIAAALAGSTTRCYFSFATFYGKVARRLAHSRIQAIDLPLAAKQALVADLVEIAAAHGITLFACCQPELLNEHIQPTRCVDGELLAALFPDRPPITRAAPSREGCGCMVSRDIGMYDTCPYGCVYCYATNNPAAALARHRAHDPQAEQLLPGQSTKPG
ncbi:MAG: DUF1848 domain-containing protein [Chloroflexi bacterium]|nr:DUF1848 domain-containing protein [Chloroflexota bacterium]